MDNLDFSILREMVAGSHPYLAGVDPRVSTAEIAAKLDVDRTTVWSRVREWERAGFLKELAVVPHPSLFGATVGPANVRVPDPRLHSEVVRSLALTEGIYLVNDGVSPWMTVWAISQSGGGFRRLAGLVGKLPGIDNVLPFRPLKLPNCGYAPSNLDWKIIRLLRTQSKPSLSRIARALHLSSTTLAKRYHRLLTERVIWYIPVLDFSKDIGGSTALFTLTLRPGADPATALQSVCRSFEGCFSTFDPSTWGLPTGDPVTGRGPFVLAFVRFDSAAKVGDAVEEIAGFPGVQQAESAILRRNYFFSHWFDERMASPSSPSEPTSAALSRGS